MSIIGQLSRGIVAVATFLFTLGALPPAPAEAPAAAPLAQTSDPVTVLNEAFRAAYLNTKQEILTRTDPVILMVGDKAILLRKGERTEFTYVPALFHTLKTVDHVPLALFVQLRYASGLPLNQSVSDRLKQFRSLILQARPGIQTMDLADEKRKRQLKIIDGSLAYLDEVLEKGRTDEARLKRFIKGLQPLIMLNVADAVALELDSLNRKVIEWKKSMSPEEWSALTVVVAASHMPRETNSQMQYFLALLDEKREGERVIYLEGAEEEWRALDLLVTHVVDRSIAECFFDDPWRMHRDLLGDAAHDYIKAHPPGQ